jgi:hypothetical protein
MIASFNFGGVDDQPMPQLISEDVKRENVEGREIVRGVTFYVFTF